MNASTPHERSRPMTVALVNDYEVVVKGLAKMLEPFPDRIRVLEYDMRTDVERTVDIALYDTFARPQGAHLEIEHLIDDPGVRRVVIYSFSSGREVVRATMSTPVQGYLSKSLSGREIVEALERIHESGGEEHPEPPTRRAKQPGDWPGRSAGLTSREAEIVAMIAQGFTNEEIAKRIYLSINTIKTYIRSAYRRMGVTTRSQAVRWAAQNGFTLEPPRRLFP